jgi:hypothetical protein
LSFGGENDGYYKIGKAVAFLKKQQLKTIGIAIP